MVEASTRALVATLLLFIVTDAFAAELPYGRLTPSTLDPSALGFRTQHDFFRRARTGPGSRYIPRE